MFRTWDTANTLLSPRKWWSKQSLTISNCLNWSEVSPGLGIILTLFSSISSTSCFMFVVSNICNSLRSCSAQWLQVSNTSFSRRMPYSFASWEIQPDDSWLNSDLEPRDPRMLEAMLEKNPIAAWRRKKAVGAHENLLPLSSAPSKFNKSWE